MKTIIKKQSIPETLHVEAKSVKTKGINIKGRRWKFLDDDPQIIIRFPQPVMGIYYRCKLGKASFEAGRSVLYYRGKKEAFSEIKACRMPILPNHTIERKIFFHNPIIEIRFDPLDFVGECEIIDICFQMLDCQYSIKQALKDKVGYAEKGILILSHDLSKTGAPLLAYHIAEELKKRRVSVALISAIGGSGFLEQKLIDKGIPSVLLSGDENALESLICIGNDNLVMNSKEFSNIIFAALKDLGFDSAIANTIVSSLYVEILKQYNYRVTSLIHEMRTCIEFYGYREEGKKIADYADNIVFPTEIVKDGFLELYSCTNGKCYVHPQGIYLNDSKDNKEDVTQQFQEIFHQNKISMNQPFVLSSGSADLLKGADLFVTSAIMLKKNINVDVQFIWVGEFVDIKVKTWLEDQIYKAGCEKYIHFIPFIKDSKVYTEILTKAEMFWAMSREDSFPSTVLEAMKNRVPVIGFSGTGGIEVMLSGGRGVLVDNFNLTGIVEASKKILKEKDKKMLMAAEEYTDSLEFDKYVDFLRNIQDDLRKR